MGDLKLPKLPDRSTVKVTINLSPELSQALDQYAEAYEAAYGEREAVAELIPFMLSSFLAGDRKFGRARKAKGRAG